MTRIYSDVQLTALLEKSEVVIDPSKCKQQNKIGFVSPARRYEA